jgi:hypothetical protein
MNVEIGAEAALFPEKEYIKGIFVAMHTEFKGSHTAYPNCVVQLLFAICFCIRSYVHQQLLSLDCQNFVQLYLYCCLPILGTLLVQGFSFERDLQFSKFFKNTICIGLCKLKCTEKRFIPFTPLHFLP